MNAIDYPAYADDAYWSRNAPTTPIPPQEPEVVVEHSTPATHDSFAAMDIVARLFLVICIIAVILYLL